MVLVERANPTDRLDVERLIAAYLTSEAVKPRPERITWAVEQVMKNRDGRPHGVRPGHPLESVDHLAVRPERLLPEFLAALRAADPRPRALRVLRVERPEELGHLECNLLRLRFGAVEAFHLAEEVRVQVDLGPLRDPVEPVRLQPHVEPLPVVKGLECDQVERLALGSVPQGDHRCLDRRERHPPRKRGLHRTPHAPYATFADTSE